MPVLMFAFLAGILTILSPCILPVVPPIAGTASTRGRRRLAGIVTGFAGMSVAVTVVLASTLAAAGLTTDRIRLASAVLLRDLRSDDCDPAYRSMVEARSPLPSTIAARLLNRRRESGFATLDRAVPNADDRRRHRRGPGRGEERWRSRG
jgi:hypothetical protein